KAAINQIERAKAAGDTAGAEQLRHEAYSLVVGMGLLEAAPATPIHAGPGGKPVHEARVTGPEAAERRLKLIDEALGPDAAKLRELVTAAKGNTAEVGQIRAERAAARERLRTWCEKMIAERKAKNAALAATVDAAIGPDGTGHVFDR